MTQQQSTKTNVQLIGAQSEVWDAMYKSDKNVIAVLPVGSGKSFLAALLLPIAANVPEMHKGRDILYVAPTYPMLERIIWSPLKKVCIEDWGLTDEREINNSKKIITFPNGIRIHCVSAETGLKGINASLIMADEAAEYTEEALQELSNRIRPIPGQEDSVGRMILISTPEGKNAFHDMYQIARLNPDRWIVIHKTYSQMRVQSKKWIEEQRYLLSPLKFKKDLMCDWGSVTDQFFYTWRNDYLVHKIEDKQKELYSFHDFNKKCMTAIVAQVIGQPTTKDGKIEILKAYAMEDYGTEDIAKKIREDFPTRKIHCIMDRSGAQTYRDTTSVFGRTDESILQSYGFRIINNAKSNPLISDTDNSCNAFIAQGRLVIQYDNEIVTHRASDKQIKLTDVLETYHFEDGARKTLVKYKEAKYMYIDGLGDCLRYGIHHLFPMMVHVDHTLPEYLDSDTSLYVEPGAEYISDNERLTINGVPTIKGMIKQLNDEGSDEYWW